MNQAQISETCDQKETAIRQTNNCNYTPWRYRKGRHVEIPRTRLAK